MTRIYERQTDALFRRAFAADPDVAALFLSALDSDPENRIVAISTQTPHRDSRHRGSIDLEITRADGSILMVENKIDAGYSVTRVGDPQPARYRASVATLVAMGQRAASVLLAPEIYLRGTRHTAAFDYHVSYETLRPALTGNDLALLDAAIAQAATPYEPEPNLSSAAFFADFEAYSRNHFPELVIKDNPNGMGVRPVGSRTIYFNVPRTLRDWERLPRPRMSIQCRDGAAPLASVKIMLGGLGLNASGVKAPGSLHAIGGYIRAAGRSLGLVIDTPELDTQIRFDAQVHAVEENLEAARRLVTWWNRHAGTLQI